MKRSNGGMVLGITISLFAWAATTATASSVDYDTAFDLVNKFNLNVNPPATNKYFQVTSGGLGNSGAVDLMNTTDADHTTAVYNGNAFSFGTPGNIVSISQFFKRQNASNTSTPFAQMGIVSDLSERMDAGTSSNSYASLRIMPSTDAGANSTTDIYAQVETKVSGGGRLRTPVAPNLTIVAGRWYLMSATFAYLNNTTVSVFGSLEDWGTTGAAFSSSVFSFGPTSVALNGTDQINGDLSVWAGYRAFQEGGVDLMDNFSVVPEPATLGLLGIVLLFIRRKR